MRNEGEGQIGEDRGLNSARKREKIEKDIIMYENLMKLNFWHDPIHKKHVYA